MLEQKPISLESEAGFRVLFECATISILVINEQGIIELVNPCAEALFAYQPAELIGQPLEVLLPEYLRSRHVQHMRGYFAKPKTRPMGVGLELKALKKDGTEFPVEISLGHYWISDQPLAVAFVTDITQRQKDMEVIKQSEAMLASEESSLIYLNKTSNALWQINSLEQGLEEILNASIELLRADKGNVQLLVPERNVLVIAAHKGFTMDSLDFFDEVSADDDSSYRNALYTKQQIVIEDTEQADSDTFKNIARKCGFRSVVSTPLFNVDGAPIGIISTYFVAPHKFTSRDLNRIKLHAHNAESFIGRHKMFRDLERANALLEGKVSDRTAELSRSLEREKEMNELKSRFVSMASHEFRTPLSIVLSSTTLVEQYITLQHDERIQKHLTRIKSSVGNLTNILNDFLSLDKLEQGNVELELDTFNIPEFMNGIVEDVQGTRKNGQQVVMVHDGYTDVVVDQKKLRYIMINLISNSMKYSPEESEVTVTSVITADDMTIAVADHGIGIPEEEQKYLYNKFFRARNTGNIQGTGLGLTIVKRYVDLMGGEVSCISKQGEGTTFTIKIPNVTHP